MSYRSGFIRKSQESFGEIMRRKTFTPLKLEEEQMKYLNDSIVEFYATERGEEIGLIHSRQLVDLFIEELAPIIYNKALDDAMRFYKHVEENASSDYFSLYKEIS